MKGAYCEAMADIETVINGLNDIGGFIAGRVGFERARNFLRTIDDTIELLKEQDGTIRELQNAYDYLQRQFFESQDKLLKEQEAKCIHREDMDFIDKYNCTHFHGMCTNCGLVHDFIDRHTGQYLYCQQCGRAVKFE